jgi:hypothetical protein
VVAAPLEQLIADAILLRLDTPQLLDALSGAIKQQTDTGPLMESISADREQLEELATAYAMRSFPLSEWMTARKVIEDRMQASERRLRRATNTSQLASVAGRGEVLADQWPSLNLGRQRAIIETIFDHAVIGPGASAARAFDPGRVSVVWRL